MASLDALPDELLLAILSEHMPLLDLAACALVCRRWRRLLDCRSFRHYHNARYAYLLSTFQALPAGALRHVDLDLADKRGRRPLHAAVMAGDAALADLVLRRIHDEVRSERRRLEDYVDKADSTGYTPLLLAVAKRNLPVVARLADLGADVNASTVKGRTPIHLAVEAEDPRLVKLLLSHGARLDVFDLYGMSPLHLAAGAASFGMPRQTPDHAAAVEIVRALLDGGADPMARDLFFQTPLHAAALAGADVFELIMCRALSRLSHEKDPAQSPSPVRPQLDSARSAGREEACGVARPATGLGSGSSGAAALPAGAPAFPPTPSPASCGGADGDGGERAAAVTRVHDHPASCLDRGGYSPLHRAAQAGHQPVMVVAVRQTSETSVALPRNVRPLDIDVRSAAGRSTALHMAVREGHWDCARALVSAGADVAAKDSRDRTPLDYAAATAGFPRDMAAAWAEKNRPAERVKVAM